MKIEEPCKPAPLPILYCRDVPPGTVFRYGDHTFGPYLKLDDGYIDLAKNIHYRSNHVLVERFQAFPNARVVLE